MNATFELSNGRKVEFPLVGDVVVGCGGNETPIPFRGKHYLYVWDKVTNERPYYCFEDDLYCFKAPWDNN